jgi:tRNA(Ile)-lysidine synthase
MTLDPAVAAVRVAVRPALVGAERVLVACSGGADSLGLLAATVFEARRDGVRVIGATVDHGLQPESRTHAAHVVEQMAALGADETATVRVTVDPGPAGIEAGAREARYVALGELAGHLGADRVLLGHTRDDQAETVLLGLARGSGARSLQGMRREYVEDGVRFVRPLLDLTRAQTEAACRAERITWWEDPHNQDPRFTRSRVRHTVLPLLEDELGPGVASALARTADQLRDDVATLDALAEEALAALDEPAGLDVAALAAQPRAVCTRILRLGALRAGAIADELTREHVLAIAALVHPAKDPRLIRLPGHVTAYRDGDRLRFGPTEAG